MFDSESFISALGIAPLVVPILLVAVMGLASLLGRPLTEGATSRLVQLATVLGLFATLGVLIYMLATGQRHVAFNLGHWASIPHFDFSFKLIYDRLSVPFVLLTFLLCGTIGAFGTRYLHREPGYNRFFTLYAIFLLGMVLTSLAGTIESLFAGWELVGISSALLVAFFQERAAPVRNGLRVWLAYRMSDAALLMAAVVLHHLSSHGDFDELIGTIPWPEAHVAKTISAREAFLVGSLLLIAAAGKSALIPFSGWLPRAMEGPTPSSAIFYGALSVHLGAYLLLRMSPLIELSLALSLVCVALGLASAVLAGAAARVQADIKSALAFASLTQVGVIVAEIGLAAALTFIGNQLHGQAEPVLLALSTALRYVALIHIIGHACVRTLQFLRASSVLQDYRMLENAIGERLSASKAAAAGGGLNSSWWFRFALERGYLDGSLDYLGQLALRAFRICDQLERGWTDWLSGRQSRESDLLSPSAELDDLS
jgi:NADH-quinone oxidoreductase subunit L